MSTLKNGRYLTTKEDFYPYGLPEGDVMMLNEGDQWGRLRVFAIDNSVDGEIVLLLLCHCGTQMQVESKLFPGKNVLMCCPKCQEKIGRALEKQDVCIKKEQDQKVKQEEVRRKLSEARAERRRERKNQKAREKRKAERQDKPPRTSGDAMVPGKKRGRPKIESPMTLFTLYMEPQTITRIDKVAAEIGIDRSKAVRGALRHGVKHLEILAGMRDEDEDEAGQSLTSFEDGSKLENEIDGEKRRIEEDGTNE